MHVSIRENLCLRIFINSSESVISQFCYLFDVYCISFNQHPSYSSNFQISAPNNFPTEEEIIKDFLIYFQLQYCILQQLW